MSLVASRVSLTHRCTIERNTTTTTNPHGTPDKATWQPHLTDYPCRLGLTAGREVIDEKTTAVIEDMRLIVTVDTDVTEKDRVSVVTYRGSVFAAGPIGIRAVLRRHDHLELVLVRIA